MNKQGVDTLLACLEFDVFFHTKIKINLVQNDMRKGVFTLSNQSTAYPQVNILYVAVTRAKRKLVLNSSLSDFFANTGSWDSVCLRGVSTMRDSNRSSASFGADADECACCKDPLTGFGSRGDKPSDLLSKNQALEIFVKVGLRILSKVRRQYTKTLYEVTRRGIPFII